MLALKRIFLSVAIINYISALPQLPPNWPRCYRDDPQDEFNACLLKAAETVKPFLKAGVPSLRIPSLEKVEVQEVSLERGNENSNLKAALKDVLLYGLYDYEFKKFDFDKENLRISLELNLPHLYIKGIYMIKGNIVGALLEGQGNFFSNVTNTVVNMEIAEKIVKRKGVEYIVGDEYNTKLQIGKLIDYDVSGLFADNEVLERATRTVIRENLGLVVEALQPAIEHVCAKIASETIVEAVHSVPYNDLYPKHK